MSFRRLLKTWPAGNRIAGGGAVRSTLEMNASATVPRIDSLTAVRFFAAAHVVFFHVGYIAASRGGEFAAALSSRGYAAVGLFYVLSGFVLAYNYSSREFTRGGFWRARFARIYPIYLFSLLLALPGFLNHLPDFKGGPAWVAGVLFAAPAGLQAWFPPIALAWNAPAWSLSVEFFFYFLFPFLLGPIQRLGRSKQVLLIGILWVLSIAPSALYCWLSPLSFSDLTHLDPVRWTALESGWVGVLNFNPLLRLAEFVAGMVLGALFLTRTKDSIAARYRLDAGALFSSLTVLIFLGAPDVLPYPFLHNGILLPAWCLLIYSLGGGEIVRRLFSWKWLVILGEASYAMYILQQPVSTLFKGVLLKVFDVRVTGAYPSARLFGSYFLVLVAASVLSYFFLERPLRRVIVDRFGRAARRQPLARAGSRES
jgi:peptidoglycan/LPS O-acetylase OafA/YrhL